MQDVVGVELEGQRARQDVTGAVAQGCNPDGDLVRVGRIADPVLELVVRRGWRQIGVDEQEAGAAGGREAPAQRLLTRPHDERNVGDMVRVHEGSSER
jgi:hypothetical protein